jgi:hypothetical protein
MVLKHFQPKYNVVQSMKKSKINFEQGLCCFDQYGKIAVAFYGGKEEVQVESLILQPSLGIMLMLSVSESNRSR